MSRSFKLMLGISLLLFGAVHVGLAIFWRTNDWDPGGRAPAAVTGGVLLAAGVALSAWAGREGKSTASTGAQQEQTAKLDSQPEASPEQGERDTVQKEASPGPAAEQKPSKSGRPVRILRPRLLSTFDIDVLSECRRWSALTWARAHPRSPSSNVASRTSSPTWLVDASPPPL